jgi:hypothetical protein
VAVPTAMIKAVGGVVHIGVYFRSKGFVRAVSSHTQSARAVEGVVFYCYRVGAD